MRPGRDLLPLGGPLCPGQTARDARPARDGSHLGKLHQARADREHLQRVRSPCRGRDGGVLIGWTGNTCASDRCSQSCSALLHRSGHDGGSLDAALVAAEYGMPVGFMTMTSCLTTGPATLAGTLAVGNAEVIAGTALLQLAYPGRAGLLCRGADRL